MNKNILCKIGLHRWKRLGGTQYNTHYKCKKCGTRAVKNHDKTEQSSLTIGQINSYYDLYRDMFL